VVNGESAVIRLHALCHGMGSNDFQSTDLLFFDQCYRICTYL